jgi:hypothetical protein
VIPEALKRHSTSISLTGNWGDGGKSSLIASSPRQKLEAGLIGDPQPDD